MAIRQLIVGLALGVLAASAVRTRADDATMPQAGEPTEIAGVLLASLDVVFREHVDPPTRGELLRRGIKAILTRSDSTESSSLGRRITALELAEYPALLQEMLAIARRSGATDEDLKAAFLEGLLGDRAVKRGAMEPRYIAEAEYRVQQQIRDNRYVGIGIQLTVLEGRPAFAKVLPGGPVSKGGGRDGDIILEIDGADTEGMSVSDSIELLRGGEGEPVSLIVRQQKETTERTLDLVRGEVPFETVVGHVREADGWAYDIEPTKKIAYVKITAIRGSTVGELREVVRRLRRLEFAAWILDLRHTDGGDLRHTIILADELNGAAPLGSYTTAHGTHEAHSNAQSVWPDVPLAVLVDHAMPEGARWLAATLQDNERGLLVGIGTPTGEWYVRELTKLPTGAGALLLPTAILHRPNPAALPDRATIQWSPSVGFDRSKFTKREFDLGNIRNGQGANSRLLLPDHLVDTPRIPGNRRGAGSVTMADPCILVASEVLKEKMEPGDAD